MKNMTLRDELIKIHRTFSFSATQWGSSLVKLFRGSLISNMFISFITTTLRSIPFSEAPLYSLHNLVKKPTINKNFSGMLSSSPRGKRRSQYVCNGHLF
jgi:hypothetical protein